MLLAYDGSPKAGEALFVATYLASAWNAPLLVVTATDDDRSAEDAQAQAQDYLSVRGVAATYLRERGFVAETILSAAQEAADLIIMGGYGFAPLVEAAVGSTVEQVLRSSAWPVLICQ